MRPKVVGRGGAAQLTGLTHAVVRRVPADARLCLTGPGELPGPLEIEVPVLRLIDGEADHLPAFSPQLIQVLLGSVDGRFVLPDDPPGIPLLRVTGPAD